MHNKHIAYYSHTDCYSVRNYSQSREHKNSFIRKTQSHYNPNQQILSKSKDGKFIGNILEFSLTEKENCF